MRVMRPQTDWFNDGRVWRHRERWLNLIYRIFRDMRAEYRPTTRRPLVRRRS
jgi:hypothetical protein